MEMPLYFPKMPMKIYKILLILLALTILLPSPSLAKDRDWKPARVVNMTETSVSWELTGQKNTMHYTIETENMVYFGDYTFRPSQHSNGHAPEIGGDISTKIAIEGHSAYVLDANGKEVKLHIVKKTKKT